MGAFVLQGSLGNIWSRSWWSHLGEGATGTSWEEVRSGMLPNILYCIARSPRQRSIWPQMSQEPRLRNLFLSNVCSLPPWGVCTAVPFASDAYPTSLTLRFLQKCRNVTASRKPSLTSPGTTTSLIGLAVTAPQALHSWRSLPSQ